MTRDDYWCTDPRDLEPSYDYEAREQGAAPPWFTDEELVTAREAERRWIEQDAAEAVVTFLREMAAPSCESCSARSGETHASWCGMCRDCGGEDGRHAFWCACDERRRAGR